jgi:hypothetical protein
MKFKDLIDKMLGYTPRPDEPFYLKETQSENQLSSDGD